MSFLKLAASLGEDLKKTTERAGEGAGYGAADAGTLPIVVGRVIFAVMGILGVVLVALLVYGGYTWMTAQGDEDDVKKAQNIIRQAVIGLVIIFVAYAIAQFVISRLVTSVAGLD